MKRRAILLGVIVTLSMLVLILRVAHLQLVEGDSLANASFQQRLRLLSTPAPRGNIVSADGVVLAGTRPAFVAQYIPSGDPPTREWINLLAFLTDVPRESITEAIDRGARTIPYAPVDLKVDLSPGEYTALLEHKHRLPGLRVVSRPVRTYPRDDLASHVMGYILKINEEELQSFGDISGRVYENTHLVGKVGVERAAEFYLQGHDGQVRIEVDAAGRLVDSITGRTPVSGNDVHLTLDSDLQRVLQNALATVSDRLQEGLDPLPYDPANGNYVNLWDPGSFRPADSRRPARTYSDATSAAAVVLDVRTGAVLAMASHPGFDLNAFATAPLHLPGTEEARAWAQEWEYLNSVASDQPLLNRATAQVSAPGSTFKMVTALAYLEAGNSAGHTESCPGYLDIFGQRYGCWGVHGSAVNLHAAIAQSCNVFFYHAGLATGIDGIESMARELGLGDPTGVLGLGPGEESAGTRPGREWKMQTLEEVWYPGETLMAAIGQGFHAYTPLQMANYVATIASGGIRHRPYLLDLIVSPSGDIVEQTQPEIVHELTASEESIARIQRGMEAVAAPGGTSFRRFWDYPKIAPETGREVAVASKTGTAEVGSGAWRMDSHGWFVAYAPVEEPEVAIAVVVDHGGGGSLAGAPVVRTILEAYFGFDDATGSDDLIP